MSWLQRKQIRAFLKNSLWIPPVASMLAAMICAPIIRRLDQALQMPFLDFGLEGARGAIGMISAAMLSFVVFFFSVMLLTVQIASGTLSPRIIARPFQLSVLKVALSLFVFTFSYGVGTLGRLETHVFQLPVLLTLLLSVASVGMFLFVVEHVGKTLRPVSVVTAVAREGCAVIRNIYPLPWRAKSIPETNLAALLNESSARTVTHRGRPGVIVAFDTKGLVEIAERHASVIELVPQVGDFVGVGSPLFRVYFGGDHVRDSALRRSIALGPERTMEQDPAFAFRIIVDIAEKALSPAINDPTTGVLSIDQIQFLLQEVGKRDLSTGVMCDGSGKVRLVYRTPEWRDFVLLAVSEIRQYGASSVQIVRRLRAMLEDLIKILPPERATLLQQQLDALHLTVEEQFSNPRDREQAEIPDSQGLGGSLTRVVGV